MDNKLLFSHYARLIVARRVYKHCSTAFAACVLVCSLAGGKFVAEMTDGEWPIVLGLINIFAVVIAIQVSKILVFLRSIYPSPLMTMRLEDAQAIVKRELEYELHLQPTPNTEEKP